MSAQLHDVGSIINFWPASPLKRPGSEDNYATDFVGIALVVATRSTWVITTELRPVRLVDGQYVIDKPGDPQ